MEQNQQKYLELQILEQQMKQLESNLQSIDQQLVDIHMIKGNIEEFGSLKKNSESLMPLANGIFARAKVLDNSDLLVNVGNNVVVKKSIKETAGLMDKQDKELQKYRLQLIEQMEVVVQRINSIQLELNKE